MTPHIVAFKKNLKKSTTTIFTNKIEEIHAPTQKLAVVFYFRKNYHNYFSTLK